MLPRQAFVVAILAGLLAAALPDRAEAVFSGDMSPRAPSGDADYAKAIKARESKDWVTMINNLLRVVDRRPWHDNAHTLLGYGYRQIGRYERALEHYEKALAHNPNHRGALEYMGVAFLHMGRLDRAEEMRARLLKVCRTVAVTFSDGAFGSGCEEWEMLDTIIAVYRETGEVMECE